MASRYPNPNAATSRYPPPPGHPTDRPPNGVPATMHYPQSQQPPTEQMASMAVSAHPPPHAPGAPAASGVPAQGLGSDIVSLSAQSLPRPRLDAASLRRRVTLGDVAPPYPNALSQTQESLPGLACPREVFMPASRKHIRLTAQRFPNSSVLNRKYGMPLGVIINPLAPQESEDERVPLVDFGTAPIVRCRRCRSYINFMCQFTDGGRRWKCCLCNFLNDVPDEYYCPTDVNGQRRDAAQRLELTHGSVEFVAPHEYMVRPPMPPIYLFLLETTTRSISTGALQTALDAIKESLDSLPEHGRTKIGLITFDSAVHFFQLRTGDTQHFSETVVSDIEDVFIPVPEDILGELTDCKSVFTSLLDTLPSMLADVATKPPSRVALGAAIEAASLLIGQTGGKIVTLCSSRPSLGPGALKDRADNAALGTDKERQQVSPDSTHYKQLAVEFSRKQISVDLYLCPPQTEQYLDVATLAPLSKYTGGEITHIRDFSAERDHGALRSAILNGLVRETAFEAVMRIRASKGVRCAAFFGRFFLRSTDLMALPNVDSDKTFSVQLAFDEATVAQSVFVVQSALLYTSSQGERRIRVNTIAVPTTSSLMDLMSHMDPCATAFLISKNVVDNLRDRKIEEIRKNLTNSLVTSLSSLRQLGQQGYSGGGEMSVPSAMAMLPLWIHGLFRCPLLSREASSNRRLAVDDKSALLHYLDTATVATTASMLYPAIIPLFPLDGERYPEAGLLAADRPLRSLVLPPGLPATMGALRPELVILVDDGVSLMVWIGTNAAGPFCSNLGMDLSKNISLESLAQLLLTALGETDLDRSSPGCRARALVQFVMSHRRAGTTLRVVVQNTEHQTLVESAMVEERSVGQKSYGDYWTDVLKSVQAKSSKE